MQHTKEFEAEWKSQIVTPGQSYHKKADYNSNYLSDLQDVIVRQKAKNRKSTAALLKNIGKIIKQINKEK